MEGEPQVKEEFIKILNDFTRDLQISYPEYKEYFDDIDYVTYYNYCKNIYPENFFNILYENNELFEKDESKYLLPNIDFSKIMMDESLGENSKKTIWKYLQLILFCVCNNVEDKKDFGDANYLFEAINEEELHNKINDTMNEMKEIFMNMGDCSLNENLNDFTNVMNDPSFNNMFSEEESSGNFFENMMNPEKMKDHLSGIMNGKIGTLAKEIAEEATKELGLEEGDLTPEKQQDFMKSLFKNPTKLLGIVKNIGSKLEEKFKSGDLKESELLEEAQEIMGKMKDIPGLKNMMSSMGMNPGGNFDFKGMANKMQQNMKQAKMKERMQEKMKRNREEKEKAKQDVGNLKKVEENTFVWNDENSNTSSTVKKSSKKTNNKKKGKKKNKNKN